MTWWKKAKPESQCVIKKTLSTEEANQRANERYAEKTAQLEAELSAIPEPKDLYRIEKDFKTGRFIVFRWSKSIYTPSWGRTLQWRDDPIDFRSVLAGWEPLCSNFPSHRAAQGWLRAFLYPTTNRTGYDASGEPVEPSE